MRKQARSMKFNKRVTIILVVLLSLVLIVERMSLMFDNKKVQISTQNIPHVLSSSNILNNLPITNPVGLDVGRLFDNFQQNKNKNEVVFKPKNDDEFMIFMKQRMKNRQTLLENVCKEFRLTNQTDYQIRFAVLKSHNLSYCFIPKAGCTNWKKILMVLNGDVKDINHVKQNIHAFVSNNFRYDSVGSPPGTEEYLKVIVVRNPLDRLFSSYKDKFAWQPGFLFPQFSKISSYIHRSERKAKIDTQYLATFDEFIKFVSSENRNSLYGLIANHWSSYNRLCQPCKIKYDVIAHLETIDEDSKYLLKLLKAPKGLKFPAGYGKNGSSINKHDDVIQAYKRLKHQTLETLYKAYKSDFDMFGYKFLE